MISDKAELSIIIISYNTAQITKNCINSILKSINNQINYEIIVVDNASTDGSVEMLGQIQNLKVKSQKYKAKFKIILNAQNTGFARANNQAVKEASGKYILLLNSDTVVLNDSIVKLLNCYKQNENRIHFLGGKLINKDLSLQPSCGPFYSLPVVFGWIFLRGDLWNLTRQSPNQIKETDWVSGACILTKKSIFNSVGGFDEGIFMYMDEVDLLYRAKKQGFRVFFYHKAKFIHLGSASSDGRTFPVQQAYRGLIYFYKKHYSRLTLFLLKILLKLKALIALFIGKLTNNLYLIKTYETAYHIVEES